ncbi:SUMF1/EgtB/PvdO family nonheme iron enzyme [Candidatus Viridilinea mediisalina]|uniref:Sulfatase-modifying factor enzyme-like domain-containing protein n=1 Tax=Candidatus Viridilinea mediisalina TaxID=2024553 RepID=A0A2A6RIG5_9CHLR|nr:SUMF1/EgtB/PvdO family nonheme iron enzyme [Candidatus Viridilinea mediisalina]PDW02658.1 hypothetical protein CJ255_12905 [Candidatus Viridilinea mediisalina]
MHELPTAPSAQDAQQLVERFVRRFGEAYRMLACHAALPLILTPELLHNLRNTFLRGQVPWVSEADLLLSELCRPVGYEQYAMDAAVRAHLIATLEARVGPRRLQDVARLLLRYIHHLKRSPGLFSETELQAQQLAAMVCLDEQRAAAAHTLVAALRRNMSASANSSQPSAIRAEIARLTRLTATLAPQLSSYPKLIAYAQIVERMLRAPAQTNDEAPQEVARPVTILGQTLPAPAVLLPPELREQKKSFRFTTSALDPASPAFYGRQAELARLRGLCLDNQWVVLYGGPKSGKTSLLLRLEKALRQDAVPVCRLDFQLIKGANGERAFAFIAEQIAEMLPLPPEASEPAAYQTEQSTELWPLISEARDLVGEPEVPQSEQHDATAPFMPDPRDVTDGPRLRRFLRQALTEERVPRLVLMLDEWGALPAATRETLAHALRSIFEARHTMPALGKLQIVLSGGIELYDLVAYEASPLHNICETIYLSDLSEAEAVALVTDGLSAAGLDAALATELAHAIYRRVAGHPYLTQRFGMLLVETHQSGQITDIEGLLVAAEEDHLKNDPLLRRMHDALRTHKLADAARLLLNEPPRFTRHYNAMARLELLGLAKQAGEQWAARNPLMAEVFSELLEREPSSSPATTTQVTSPSSLIPHPSSLTIPPLIHIPAGPFLMGSSDADGLAFDNEKPQHTLTLPDYWIARTPITNAQFRPFVEADGYRNRAYWTEAGWAWREEWQICQPEYWENATWNGDDYPVVGVSWYEAVAYCRWLSAVTGHEFRLPSEAEWEKAARGPDGRIWPWGDIWEEGRCNSKEAGIGKTSPVGHYPSGASPYGVLDMAGNVWEWCVTRWEKDYPYRLKEEWMADYLAGEAARVRRGGAYYSVAQRVRGASRGDFNIPRSRNLHVGLRIVSHAPVRSSDE